jgi:SWI/SNF-related matrix-associated actin-dependent regulator of chromatin subfamily A-like protein 1
MVAALPMSPKPYVITAKYASACKVCGRQVLPGDRVEWIKGDKKVSHVQCTESGQKLVLAVAESKASAPLAHSTITVPAPEGLEYLPYQIAGVQHAASREEGALIADEMGLGKTIQAVGFVNATPELRRILIVCPASLRINWERECKKWLTKRTVRRYALNLETCEVEEIEVQNEAPSVVQFPLLGDVTIANYDILGKVQKTFAGIPFDLLVIDEVHYIKNPKAQRTKNLFAIRQSCKKGLGLTGTPILNASPLELFPILQLVAPQAWDPPGLAMRKDENGKKSYVPVGAGGGAGFFRFAKRFCNAHEEWISKTKKVWVFDGSSNLDELSEKLRSTCMVRRMKADVLKELPPKRRSVICFPKDGAVEGMVDEENTLLGEVLKCATLEEVVKALANVKMGFEAYSAARLEIALVKVPLAVEHLESILGASPDSKVVVFAHHHEVVDKLRVALCAYGVVTVTGTTSLEGAASRQTAVDTFQNDPKCRVIIGTIGAMGVGWTLTKSQHVVHVELPLRPSDLSQDEDRTHRIGQRGSVLSELLVFDGSVDAHIARMLVEKQDVANMALDANDALDIDVAARAVDETALTYAKAKEKAYADAGLTPEECAKLLAEMQYLAGVCDGAQQLDGHGFSRLDANFGHALAACKILSPKQAIAARKLAVKYRRQLEGRVFE